MTRNSTRTLIAALATLLALSCLGPLFAPGGGWVLPSVIAIVVAAVAGTIGRLLPVPGVLGPILSLVGGLLLVTAVSSPGNAYLGFIPSGDTFGTLQELTSSGFSDVQTYAPPVAVDTGLILLTTAGVFIVAVLVDLLAVTGDRPLLAGVPLLGLVGVPAAFEPSGLGLVHIGLAAVGWLLLLAVDGRDRQLRWGRPLGRPPGGRSSAGVIGGAAGRVAGVGLLAGLLLPALVPALHGGIFHPPAHCCGGGQARVIEPLVTLDQQLGQQTPQPLLSVITNNPQYLRFTALDDYNDNGFSLVTSRATPGRVDGQLSVGTPGLGPDIATQEAQDTITVGNLAEKYLPLPYSPVNVAVNGDWQLIPGLRTVFSPDDTTAGLSFQVVAEVPEPSAAQLREHGYDPAATPADLAAALAPDLAVPTSVPSILGSLADRVTASGKTEYDKLFLLEQYFTDKKLGGYSYNLRPGLPPGAAGITAFLTTNRNGFCQQFATVFTLMARHLGLPARVAVGFTPGQEITQGNYDVSTADAHAWPEVWFTDVGWVRFEPTPRSDIAAYRPGYLQSPTAPKVTKPSQAPTSTPLASVAPIKPKIPRDPAPSRPAVVAVTHHGFAISASLVITVLLVLLVLAVLALPAVARILLRRRRMRLASGLGAGPGGRGSGDAAGESAHAAWAELMDSLIDVGLPLSASETPRATERRIGELLSQAGGTAVTTAAGVSVAVGVAVLERPGRPGSTSAGLRDRGDVVDLGELRSVIGPGVDPAIATRATAGLAPETIGSQSDGSDGSGTAEALEALSRLRSAEESARYARPDVGGAPVRGIAEDSQAVRGALLAGAGRGTRLRALLLPPSTIALARDASRSALRTLGARTPKLGDVLIAARRLVRLRRQPRD